MKHNIKTITFKYDNEKVFVYLLFSNCSTIVIELKHASDLECYMSYVNSKTQVIDERVKVYNRHNKIKHIS